MIDDGVSGYANVAEVTGGFFDVLGVQPVLGRTLSPADDKEGAENVIVLQQWLSGTVDTVRHEKSSAAE